MMGKRSEGTVQKRRFIQFGALLSMFMLVLCLIPHAAMAAPTSFKDVPKGEWYYTWVTKASQLGLMGGFKDNSGKYTGYFGPDEAITRAQVATVLWRSAGSPESGSSGFKDVPSSAWYSQAVSWCAKAGIVTGYTSGSDKGKFCPDRAVNRQELATMVWRYAKYRGIDVSYPESGAFKSAVDWQSVDSFAVEPMRWTAATGVLAGVNLSNGTRALQPTGGATRAQAAKVFSVVTSDILTGKVTTPKASYAILYSDGLLSLQRGANTASSHGRVLGKWEWDGQSAPWIDMRTRVKSVVVRDKVNYYGTGSLFGFLTNCTSFDVAKLNVSTASSLAWMFRGCESVTSLDLSSWDVSRFTDFWQMFSGCSKVKTLNLSGWNVSNVDSFGFMFSGCRSLRTLNLSGWAPKATVSGESVGLDPTLVTTVTVGSKFNHGEWFSPRGSKIYWRHSNGKLYYSFPNYTAGTFTFVGSYAASSLPVDGQGEESAVESGELAVRELDGIQYVVVEETSQYEEGIDYPELGGKFVGAGVYIIGYRGENVSFVLPLQIDGVAVVSADLSWNEGTRQAMTRISSLEFERSDAVESALVQLNVAGNQLHALDVAPLVSLRLLDCQDNPVDDFSELIAWAALEGHEIKGPSLAGDESTTETGNEQGGEDIRNDEMGEGPSSETESGDSDDSHLPETPDGSEPEPSTGQTDGSASGNDLQDEDEGLSGTDAGSLDEMEPEPDVITSDDGVE